MIFSIEYAHYDGSDTLENVIEFTNDRISNHLNLYLHAQKTIMFDDIHSKISFDDYRAKLSKLNILPDCFYPESAFEPLMSKLFLLLEDRGFTHIQEDGKDYIQSKDKAYNQDVTFLVRSYDKNNNEKFSCPSLVAASYLYKLGFFDDEIIGYENRPLNKSKQGKILSILPTKYLQVEANARNIISLVSPDDMNRIEYIFY